jgi:non-ribosomal peptide synthetase component F
VLRLSEGGLEELAKVEEERIEPFENYVGVDWPSVKRRRTASIHFTQQSGDKPARLRVSYRQEVVKFTGAAPSNVYWRESDGVWHQARRHWRARNYELMGEVSFGEEQFVWSEQQRRFVREGS